MGRKIHSTAINTKRLKKGEDIVRRGKIIHILRQHSTEYIVQFRVNNRYRQYIGEVPHCYSDASKETAVARIVENAILYCLELS